MAWDCGWGRGRFCVDDEEDDPGFEAGDSSASSSSTGAGVVGGGSLSYRQTHRQTQLTTDPVTCMCQADSPARDSCRQFAPHVHLVEGKACRTSLQPRVSSDTEPVPAAALVDMDGAVRCVLANGCDRQFSQSV